MKLRSLAAVMFVTVVGFSATLAFSEDEHEENEGGERGLSMPLAGPTSVRPVDNALYVTECGGCHFAYQPGLLPEASWKEIMGTLADHFGENAELEADTQKMLTEYLLANAAESDGGKIARGMLKSTRAQGAAPLRITQKAYFMRQHDELSPRVWRDNPKVGSMSNCSACHTQADKASFDEHQVQIPGVRNGED